MLEHESEIISEKIELEALPAQKYSICSFLRIAQILDVMLLAIVRNTCCIHSRSSMDLVGLALPRGLVPKVDDVFDDVDYGVCPWDRLGRSGYSMCGLLPLFVVMVDRRSRRFSLVAWEDEPFRRLW